MKKDFIQSGFEPNNIFEKNRHFNHCAINLLHFVVGPLSPINIWFEIGVQKTIRKEKIHSKSKSSKKSKSSQRRKKK